MASLRIPQSPAGYLESLNSASDCSYKNISKTCWSASYLGDYVKSRSTEQGVFETSTLDPGLVTPLLQSAQSKTFRKLTSMCLDVSTTNHVPSPATGLRHYLESSVIEKSGISGSPSPIPSTRISQSKNLDTPHRAGTPPKYSSIHSMRTKTLFTFAMVSGSNSEKGAFGSALAESSLDNAHLENIDTLEEADTPGQADTQDAPERVDTVDTPEHVDTMDTPERVDTVDTSEHVDIPEELAGPDAEVEALIKRIQENVVIRDVPTKASQWFHVPKGFIMDLELQPAQVLKSRADFKAQVKKRREEGELPKWTNRGWQNRNYGFRPQEINWNSAVSIPDCKPSNLTNPIHPFFDRNRFDDTPDAIYDQLVPALQLATLFLTQPICMKFWVTLAMGERSTDLEMTAKNHGMLSTRIASHVELTAERAKTIIDNFEAVSKTKVIHYRFTRKLQTSNDNTLDSSAYAISLPICDYKALDSETHGGKRSTTNSIIRLNTDYYVVAQKLSQLQHQEVSQKLRFSFGFAVIMIHELVHSMEGIHFRERDHQWIDYHKCNFYKEPYWLDWHESECGRAWEQTMFGGHIQPINRKVDASHGIAVADWPFGGTDEDPEKYRWWTVSMQYIEHMFQMETWQRVFDLEDWDIFHIPRDGATSLYLNCFTTMYPSEEDRVAKEELAESVARSRKEPVTKKRLKGSGETEERRPDEEEVMKLTTNDQEQSSAGSALPKRASTFPGTRGLSSVMPGPLPDDAAEAIHRPILKPHSRKTSSGAPKPTVESPEAKVSLRFLPSVADEPRTDISDGFERRQIGFLKEQHQKDEEQGARDKNAEDILALSQFKHQQPTSEIIKKAKTKTKAKGLLKTYKKKKAENKRKQRIQAMTAETTAKEDPKIEYEPIKPNEAHDVIEAGLSEQRQDALPGLEEEELLDDSTVEEVMVKLRAGNSNLEAGDNRY